MASWNIIRQCNQIHVAMCSVWLARGCNDRWISEQDGQTGHSALHVSLWQLTNKPHVEIYRRFHCHLPTFRICDSRTHNSTTCADISQRNILQLNTIRWIYDNIVDLEEIYLNLILIRGYHKKLGCILDSVVWWL